MQIDTDILAFPPCITGADVNDAEQALAHARIFYNSYVDAPRTVAEALDQYQLKLSAGDGDIVGTDDAPFTETTRQAAKIAVPDLAIIAEEIDEHGHGFILLHSADLKAAPGGLQYNHRLLLVVWSDRSDEHTMADVTDGVRIEDCHEYNEEIAARLEPSGDGDGTYKTPDGQVRYVVAAGETLPGTRIIYAGLPRTVADCVENPPLYAPDQPNEPQHTVTIEFCNGNKITVPRDLEITYIDNAG